ncbi:MAG: PAS domain S-box protein, partial [Bacteroidetes bacterium]
MRTLLSADNYRLFFENALNAIAFHEIILDAGGKPVDYVFLKVNPAFEAVTGFKAADIQGKRVREVIPGIENDPAGWIGKYGRVALTGEELKIDQYSALLGKWFRVVAFQTRPGQFCTFFDDITSQKKTEDQLRRTAHELEKRTQELDGILSSVQDYLYILNPDGEFVFANQKLLDLWGLTLEEATGKNFRQLDYPPEMESIFMNALREVVTTGRVVKNTTRYTSPGGQSGSYENLLAPMSGPDKRVTFIAGSSREISERLDLEAQLSTGRELLQTIIDSIPVMLAIWDPGIQVLQLNKAFDRI